MAKAAIFDIDMVIANTLTADLKAYNRALEPYGLQITKEQFIAKSTFSSAELARHYFKHLTEEQANEIALAKIGYFDEIVKNGEVKSVPGAESFLETLVNNGILLAAATGGPRAKAIPLLESLGVLQDFLVVVTSDDVTYRKPHPEPFLVAAALLREATGLYIAERRIVVIEDAPNGIRSARAAGMYVIGITTSHTRSELKLASPHMIIDSYDHLSLEFMRGV